LCLYKNGIVTKLPFQVIYNFEREEDETPYEISLLFFLIPDYTKSDELTLLSPFKMPQGRDVSIHTVEFSSRQLSGYAYYSGAEDEGGVVGAIDMMARHTIDKILSPPSDDTVDKKVLKAVAILYAAGFVLSTYLTLPNYYTIGYVYSLQELPKVTPQPYATFEPHRRQMGTSYTVEWDFKIGFKFKKGKEYEWSHYKGVVLRGIKGKVEARQDKTMVSFDVEPSHPFVPEMTKTYNFDKSIDKLSDEEIKSALLNFMRAFLPHIDKAVQQIASNFPKR